MHEDDEGQVFFGAWVSMAGVWLVKLTSASSII